MPQGVTLARQAAKIAQFDLPYDRDLTERELRIAHAQIVLAELLARLACGATRDLAQAFQVRPAIPGGEIWLFTHRARPVRVYAERGRGPLKVLAVAVSSDRGRTWDDPLR